MKDEKMSLAGDTQTATEAAETPHQLALNGHRPEELPDEEATLAGFDHLRLENRQLRAQLDDLTDAWESIRGEVCTECSAREALRAGLQAAQAEAEAERCSRQAAERRAEAAEAEALKSAAAAAALTERCERALRERAELRTGVAELKARLEATVRDLEKCRAEYASLSERLRAQRPLPPPPPPSQQADTDGGTEGRQHLKQEFTQRRQKALQPSSAQSPPMTMNRQYGESPAPVASTCKPDRRRTRRIVQPTLRRFSVAVYNIGGREDDDPILSSGSAMLVRLHRLERENSALRRRLGIPDDCSLPANVFYAGRSRSPERLASQSAPPPARSLEHRRLDVEKWTARHEQLKQLLEERFNYA